MILLVSHFTYLKSEFLHKKNANALVTNGISVHAAPLWKQTKPPPKFGRFWAQNPIFWGQGVKILVPSYRDSNETPLSCWKHWSAVPPGPKMLHSDPKFFYIFEWNSCFGITIFVNGAYIYYSRGNNFAVAPTPQEMTKKLFSQIGCV